MYCAVQARSLACYPLGHTWTRSCNSIPEISSLLFTDGLTEAEDEKAEEFGEVRLIQAARLAHGRTANPEQEIMKNVAAFCRGNFADDATLVVLEIH